LHAASEETGALLERIKKLKSAAFLRAEVGTSNDGEESPKLA
jgi:hypothetical protein